MNDEPFYGKYSISQAVEELAETTVSLGVISGFAVHYFGSQRQFYLPSDSEYGPLTAEQAYQRLKKLVEESGILGKATS